MHRCKKNFRNILATNLSILWKKGSGSDKRLKPSNAIFKVRNPDSKVVIIERSFMENNLPDLVHKRFTIQSNQNIATVIQAISKRLQNHMKGL